eukprot:CAMPEP_0202448786 /NCGR_PEP_ID=MMETSP1360-20130828/7579_1 /ASSEMBLY_ACC=CAM_ASM_000848 /TAXON_ID=515479 /ORGANISM="Licmophora paradoxa, Strain CCMP2313" /LENGTH=142 /DNA_ID=CAMNT_0049066497 /DNA_START=479 /DNA_END=907 /DNA_ORIENTATION=+
MQLSFLNELHLRCIPKIVVCFSPFQFFQGEQPFSFISGVVLQCLLCPPRGSLQSIVIIGRVVDKIIAEFSPDQSLFDVGSGAVAVFVELFDALCDALEGNMSVVEPWGEVGTDALLVGIVAEFVEGSETGFDEFIELFPGLV